jgi:hypothetical protein
MRMVIFLFLALPFYSRSQSSKWDIAFLKNIPDSLTQPIHLPERDYNPYFNIDETVSYHQKSRVFIIKSDSLYRKLFWRYTYTIDSLKKYKDSGINSWEYKWVEKHLVDSIPIVDFSRNELVMYAACPQCLFNCNHHGRDNEPCHRNVCNFREAWFIRKIKSD